MKKALITGVTGQDGSYLAEFLISKGYEVHGIKRRSSSFNTERLDEIYKDEHETDNSFFLHYGDLCDFSGLLRVISAVEPCEIYNLGAQSHVGVSFELPEYTADVNALGTLRLLECLRTLGMVDTCRFYQASSSELFGRVVETPQSERTPFYPRSPYAVSKLFAYWSAVNYREAYGMYAVNGILFNHESPRRGGTFVTRKIVRGLVRVLRGADSCLFVGNLEAFRDWGYAKDYVEMQWLMLQQEIPKDYVIATGRAASVRDFIRLTAKSLGIEIEFVGDGFEEEVKLVNSTDCIVQCAIDVGAVIIRVDRQYFRPSEVDLLLGDTAKAEIDLGWKAKTSLEDLVDLMVREEIAGAPI